MGASPDGGTTVQRVSNYSIRPEGNERILSRMRSTGGARIQESRIVQALLSKQVLLPEVWMDNSRPLQIFEEINNIA